MRTLGELKWNTRARRLTVWVHGLDMLDMVTGGAVGNDGGRMSVP